MKEDLLQYIWKFQFFNKAGLLTTAGEAIQIIHCGNQNTNQGPDFISAKIKIGNTIWVGNIEIHINSSGWNLHNHSADKNFDNVILHVIWNDDVEIKDVNNNALPALELKSRVSKLLLDKYRMLMEASNFIPCEKQVHQSSELTLINWKHRLVAERLIMKSAKVFSILNDTSFHWEETFWRLIASNFGAKLNSDLFLQMAKALPVTILAKHKNQVQQVESLLFGVAGLLDVAFAEKYPLMLQKEYRFYQKKYGLKTIDGKLFFLRMRPANFPTIRLAQLAILIHQSEHLFSKIKRTSSLKDIREMLDVTPNDYWHYHYIFDEASDYKKKTLGAQMINNIIINTIVPILFTYGIHYGENEYKERSIKWLEEIASENNTITKGYERLGFSNKNAFDSQFLIQMKNEYCSKKFCLNCAIGNGLLKRTFLANGI
jgi:hypothetical protein